MYADVNVVFLVDCVILCRLELVLPLCVVNLFY